MSNTEVLIVGAGPTGLMLACQLSLYNIPFRILDKTEDHTTQSRALVIQARSLEIFDQMGISEKALSHGKVAKAIGAFFNGKKIIRVTAFARVSEIGIDYRHSSLSKNGTEGIFPPHAPKPGDRLPFVKWDRNRSEMNIQDVMKGKMFCLLVFYDTIPQEIIASLEPYKEFIATELMHSNIQTQALYKAFGIQHSGCYLIRPDSYIAYRSQGFNRTAFEKYLKTNLKLQ